MLFIGQNAGFIISLFTNNTRGGIMLVCFKNNTLRLFKHLFKPFKVLVVYYNNSTIKMLLTVYRL